MNEIQWNQEIEQMKSRDLIKMRRLNTGNVSSKGSKEIHTSFYFDKTLHGSRRMENKRGRVLQLESLSGSVFSVWFIQKEY